MNLFFKRTAMLFIVAAAVFWGGVSVYASGTVDALHNGQPPVMPTQAATATAPANVYEPVPPPTFTTPSPTPAPNAGAQPAATSAPVPAVPALYPVDVRGAEIDGVRWIIKTYELSAGEKPDGIDRAGFERDGWRYELTDVTKSEREGMDTREHTETVTMNSATNDVTAIMKLLAPTMAYTSEDGYTGELALNIQSIKVEEAGTKSSTFTASVTREYPHLSSNDTSLVPKTVTDGGRTYNLAGVNWKADNTEAVDYTQLPNSYTAVATYTRTGTSVKVTGYITTAEYSGQIGKLVDGKTIYTAYFAGTIIVPPPTPTPSPPPSPTPTPTPEPTPLPASISKSANPLPAAAGATAGAGLLGGLVFFFFFRKNVKVHNLKDGKYTPIGKTRVSTKDPIINLTPFADKAASGSFILVLDRLAAKQLSGKTITVNYGDKSFQHIVEGDGGEYQFGVDF